MTSQHYLNQPGDLMKLPPDTLRAERVWIDFTDLNSLAERGAAHEAFITSYGTDKAAEFVSADEMTRLIAQAVAAEREACAKVCDEQAESHELLSNTQAVKGCDDCAAAIRARGSDVAAMADKGGVSES